MEKLASCIKDLQLKLQRYRNKDLKEYTTRTVFIDPLLESLGWDVRDPDEVALEFSTIDGKSVDYAPQINRKPVLFIEAKPLDDPLTDVKAITQVVGYASNAGVEWCVLTNGATYKVYRSTEKAEAPDKLLFEMSIDPAKTEGITPEQVAEQFSRLSRDAMAKGVLDEIGEEVFTAGKVRKAIERIFLEPPNTFLKLVRSSIGDDTLRPQQVRNALLRIWPQASGPDLQRVSEAPKMIRERRSRGKRPAKDYNETDHIDGRPKEVVELFNAVDDFCIGLAPSGIERTYLAKYVKYMCAGHIFCCVHVYNGGLRIWLKLRYVELQNPPDFVRDISKIGHWGSGDVEVAVDSIEKLDPAKLLIRQSFQRTTAQH